MNVTEPKSVVELLQHTVAIHSVNPAMGGEFLSEKTLGDYLFDLAAQWKLDAQRLGCAGHADQILITVEASEADRPWLLFDSHLDTVAATGMTVDPFGGKLAEQRIYGRGSCDTKGTGAAMLWALRAYANQPNRPCCAALLFSVDEEHAMTGIQSFINCDLPRLGWEVAAAIVGEPTEFHPIIAHHGLLRWTLTTRGVAAHSSVPHEGRSAISAMVKVIDAMETQYIPSLKAYDDLTGAAACSINTIQGGSAANIIPDFCTVEVDRRVVPGEDVQATLKAADDVLAPLDFAVERKVHIQHPPMTTRCNAQLVTHARAVLGDMKLPTMTIGAAFATHGAYFDAAGIGSVVIGPGELHKAHTKDESIPLDHLERGVELYTRLMCSGGDSGLVA